MCSKAFLIATNAVCILFNSTGTGVFAPNLLGASFIIFTARLRALHIDSAFPRASKVLALVLMNGSSGRLYS